MNPTRICNRCGTPVPASAPLNLCLRCLFDTAALDLEADTLGAQAPVSSTGGVALRTAPPPIFGDYELLGEIGRGGQGVVYRARHCGLGRVVALKTIPPAYLARAHAWERFRLEASAASRLEHPNIIPIYEVGERDGFCFYSMKLVEGTTIDQLVGGAGPSPGAATIASGPRPSLSGTHRESQAAAHGVEPTPVLPDSEECRHFAAILVKVARAVHHAHQRGVLHRDLKPNNILLDQEHEPHVSDFGLARQMTEDSSLTATQALVGTPAYFAPEVASRGTRQATVAADIYGLGAILYHLLTGCPPFRGETIAATLRAVQETEAIPPRHLNAAAARDLETICLKCLQKEPARRYATAQEVAEELERFLRDEPIFARPVSRSERAWRWCRRRPALASAIVLALVLVLVLGIAPPIATYRINRARQQALVNERKAQTEAARSAQIAKFLKKMLEGVGPSVAKGRDTAMLKEILDATAGSLDKTLKDQPEVEAELRNTLGRVYFDLGQYQKAEGMHREALAMYRKELGGENVPVADALDGVANAVWRQGRGSEAQALYRETLAMRRKLLGPEHPDIAHSLHSLANTLLGKPTLTEAEALYREALAMQRKLLGDESLDVTGSLTGLALVLMGEGKLAEAETTLREVLEVQRKLLGRQHPHIAWTIWDLAGTLSREGKRTEAETMHREALAMRRELFGSRHPDVASSLQSLADLLSQEGRLAEAEAAYREALALRRELTGNDDLGVAGSLHNCADVLRTEGKLAEAEAFYAEAFATRRKLLGNEHRDTLGSLQNLADLLGQEGKTAEAEPLLREARAMRSKLSGSENPGGTKP
jgi:serine/threonine protein kinase